MESDALQTGGGGDLPELIVHVPLLQWSARLVGEYQSMRILPEWTGSQLHFRLLPPLRTERTHNQRRGDNGSRLAAFSGNEQAAVSVFGPGQLLIDVDRAVVKVHGVPGEAQQLTLPHTGKQGHTD